LHCDVVLAAIAEGVQAGETDEMAEDADVDVDAGWLLPPPQAVRQKRSEDATKPHAS
jgi:hypothetical protein